MKTPQPKKLTKLDNGCFLVEFALNLVTYQASDWQDAVTDANAKIQSGIPMLGECGGFKPSYEHANIDLANVSHKLTKVWIDGDSVMVELQTLLTPQGTILNQLLGSNPDCVNFSWLVKADALAKKVDSIAQIYAKIA